jgi:hypothetical protein
LFGRSVEDVDVLMKRNGQLSNDKRICVDLGISISSFPSIKSTCFAIARSPRSNRRMLKLPRWVSTR